MVKKAVNTKAKSTFWSRFSTKEIDQNCSWGNWPANFTIAKSQGSAIKDLWMEKPKVQDTESSLNLQHSEFSKKTRKKKKKKQHQRSQKC